MSKIDCPFCSSPNSEFNARCTSCGADLPQMSAVIGPDDTSEVAEPAAPLPAEASLVGQTVGHYQVRAVLGAGGMGVIYRATDIRLDRSVALKFLPPHLAHDEQAKARFLLEAKAPSALDHPNIGTVYEVGEAQGQPFIAMALYEGETLKERIGRGPMQIGEVESILRQLASALATAHDAGVIHRDLKPSNVIITGTGQAKLLDFGLAKLVSTSGDQGVTRTGEIVGTVSYMAPEQLKGTGVDHRTDLWALGVVTYEMLAGTSPFQAESSVTTLTRILTEEPREIGELRPETPPILRDLLAMMLSKDPGQRLQSAADVVEALGAPSGSVPSLDTSAIARARRRGRPGRRNALALAVVLLMVGAAVGVYLAMRPGETSSPKRGRTTAPATPSKSSTRGSVGPHTAAPSGAPQRRSIAVLGFKNLSGQQKVGWLSTAIAEMLSSELAAGERLRLVPAESIARIKAELSLTDRASYAADTLARIRKSLGADFVVGGAFLARTAKGAGGLWLDARLQETRTGHTVVVAKATGSETKLFALVGRVGERLRAKLGVGKLSVAQQVRVRGSLPTDTKAARLYARGLARLRRFDPRGAKKLLEAAIGVEPKFALAHAALASALIQMGRELEARKSTKRAFELSSGLRREERLLVEALHRRAHAQWRKAIRIHRSLFDFFPDDLEHGLRLVAVQTLAGKGKEALETIRQLRRLPAPMNEDPRLDIEEAEACEVAGDYRRALDASNRATRGAKVRGARWLEARGRERAAYAQFNLGNYRSAMTEAEAARKTYEALGYPVGTVEARNSLALARERLGDLKGAAAEYRGSLEVLTTIGNRLFSLGVTINLANVLLRLGETTAARRRIQESLDLSRRIDSKPNRGGALVLEGQLELALGHPALARSSLRAAIRLLEKVGEARLSAWARHHLGEVLLAEGDLPGARRELEAAVGVREKHALAVFAAESRVGLARVALAEGRTPEAVSLARAAAKVFAEKRSPDRLGLARAVLARALLARGRSFAARAASDAAERAAGRSEFAAIRLSVAITRAMVWAASAKEEAHARARRSLRRVIGEARRLGLLTLRLDAQLALARMTPPGSPRNERARKVAVAARRAGLRLLARQAERLDAGRRKRGR